ncbi:MAG: hypothetical protein LBU32_15605 [Clostridiales bacterium]|jgi:hypothetical protein|nr:hypothetical protein [Clostridiales bacterium]
MKKYLLVLAACAAIAIFPACGGQDNPPEPSPTDSGPQILPTEEAPVEQEEIIIPTGEYESIYPPSETKFTLTQEQTRLFEEYRKDNVFDISVFKDASPVDVAQVFIECGLNGLWLGEYNLWHFATSTLNKESFKAENEKDYNAHDIRSRREMADIVFANLKDGVFEETEDNKGHITFNSIDPSDGTLNTKVRINFNLRRNSDGIWMIEYDNPYEYLDELAS